MKSTETHTLVRYCTAQKVFAFLFLLIVLPSYSEGHGILPPKEKTTHVILSKQLIVVNAHQFEGVIPKHYTTEDMFLVHSRKAERLVFSNPPHFSEIIFYMAPSRVKIIAARQPDPSMLRRLFPVFRKRITEFHGMGTAESPLGKISYRRFSAAGKWQCFLFTHSIWQDNIKQGFDIEGYFCDASRNQLTDETIEGFLSSIKVRGME